MNILVVKPSSLGDIVHTFPAVSLLRRSYPEAMIAWVVNGSLVEIVELFPAVDEVIPFHRKRLGQLRHVLELGEFIRDLRQRRYDFAFDFQGLFRSGVIAYLSGAQRRVGFRNAREGAPFFYNEKILLPANLKHAVEKNAFLVRSTLGSSEATPMPVLDTAHDLAKFARMEFDSRGIAVGSPLLAVGPAARWESKQWPPSFFAAVIDAATRQVPDLQCWLLGSEDEVAVGETVCAGCQLGRPVNLMGESTLGSLVEMLRASDVLLANDSGPMHVAAALGVPTVALFGPTDPERTGPYGKKHVVFTGECEYRPCFARQCPIPGQKCNGTVSPNRVAQAVVDGLMLSRKQR